MIFVTLGTQDKPFKRLLEVVEKAGLNERIVVQSGFTEYKSDTMEIRHYLEKDEFEKLIMEADIVICHGGVGTLITALDHRKKVIVCARKAKYGEHQNDHQQQIVDIFVSKGYVKELKEGDDLKKIISDLGEFEVKPYSRNNEAFVSKLRDYIV